MLNANKFILKLLIVRLDASWVVRQGQLNKNQEDKQRIRNTKNAEENEALK